MDTPFNRSDGRFTTPRPSNQSHLDPIETLLVDFDEHRLFLTIFSCYVSGPESATWPACREPSTDSSGEIPVLETISRPNTTATLETREAAATARDAAYFLAEQDPNSREGRRYRTAADRLNAALASPRISRLRLLLASPAVLEESGRTRSLIEMIEAEPGNSEYQLRIAKLLIRALIWMPETFPYPAE